MRLEVHVPVGAEAPAPDDEQVLATVHAYIAERATAWTEPVFLGEQDGRYRYATDAQPKAHPSIVTTSNIAPDLLPPNIA